MTTQTVRTGRRPGNAREDEFTPALRSFFEDARTWPWRQRFANALFIRDYQGLPHTSPHDIDLLIDADLQPAFADFVREKAFDHGLQPMILIRGGVSFLLICDLDASAAGRAWAFLEIRDKLQITSRVAITASSIARHDDEALPVPSAAWAAFLAIVQGVRIGDIAKAHARMEANGLDPRLSEEVFRDLLGLELKFGRNLRDSPDAVACLEEVIVRKAPKAAPAPAGWSQRLSRRLDERVYVLRRGNPLFFTLHGPDGVGKTTACGEIERLFERLPLPFVSFHHITAWKRKRGLQGDPENATVRKGDPDWTPGLVHRLLRFVFRAMPPSFRSGYVLAQGYHIYLSQLGRLVHQCFRDNSVMLVDRYIQDLIAKNELAGVGPRWIHSIAARLARPPMRAILLTDSPEAIHRRKQELTVTEIAGYLERMDTLLAASGAPVVRVHVSGKRPDEVAREVAAAILEASAPYLLLLLREGKGRARGRTGDDA